MRWSLFILSLAGLACQADGPSPAGGAPEPGAVLDVAITDSARLGAYALAVISEEDRCALAIQGPSGERLLPLAPAPPCHFLRRGQAAPQSFAYPDVGVQAVLAIAGTPLSDAERERWGLPAEAVCGAEAQGVLLAQGGVRLSTHVASGGVACKDQGLDEKDFWSFAHESEQAP